MYAIFNNLRLCDNEKYVLVLILDYCGLHMHAFFQI